jgi:hypothetical protein
MINILYSFEIEVQGEYTDIFKSPKQSLGDLLFLLRFLLLLLFILILILLFILLMVTYHYVKFYVSIIIHIEVININVRNFNIPIGFYSNPTPFEPLYTQY